MYNYIDGYRVVSYEKLQSPSEQFPELFQRIAAAAIFDDPKSWSDVTCKNDPSQVVTAFNNENPHTPEELQNFVNRYFSKTKKSDEIRSLTEGHQALSFREYIHTLWSVLERAPHEINGIGYSSIIPLPNPYIVPGGRFGEIYYWDSYFTMLGFVDRHPEMIRNMVDNFAYMLRRYGIIPNGNRSYFLSRSQPPFFFCLVGLTQNDNKAAAYAQYIGDLRTEYNFWMRRGSVQETRCVKLPDGALLNRYYDDKTTPRDECYILDECASRTSWQLPQELYRNIRAGAESGWDFSSRWLDEKCDMGSIRTTSILPIDLNAILYGLETALYQAYEHLGDKEMSSKFQSLAAIRKANINNYFWDENLGFFFDYDLEKNAKLSIYSAAALFPLFFECSTQAQAEKVAAVAEAQLLKAGGMVTTNINSGQQWDSPNGWAPLQWIAIQGLKNYGFTDLARKIKDRWITNVIDTYNTSGAMYEKYDAAKGPRGGGGEYSVQLGFGWTNGVTLALLNE